MSINLEATNIKYIGELVNFSYSGNESEDDLEHYVDGLMPIPMKEIKYDEDYGRYNPMYKRIQERPHLKYVVKNGTYDYAYYNPDETPVELKPTIVTTYSSFDEARDEMQTVFEAFKQAWESYLRERLKNGQKSFYKSTNN